MNTRRIRTPAEARDYVLDHVDDMNVRIVPRRSGTYDVLYVAVIDHHPRAAYGLTLTEPFPTPMQAAREVVALLDMLAVRHATHDQVLRALEYLE